VDWRGLNVFGAVLLTTLVTVMVGSPFLVVALAKFFVGRAKGQSTTSASLQMFTAAVFLDAFALSLVYTPNSELWNKDLPAALLVFCWMLLIGTLILGRRRTGPEIGTLKVGTFVLLAIGCLGVIMFAVG
jgi:hypothetical protein